MNDREIFIHPQAIVETSLIGEGTRVWPFTHVLKGARLGKNCNVGEQCYNASDVFVGADVVIKNEVSRSLRGWIKDRLLHDLDGAMTKELVPRRRPVQLRPSRVAPS